MRVVFTCGGTGGHINPAIAVAKLIRKKRPEAEILFMGADGGMEVTLVTREGFEIKTVPVSNFRRSLKPRDIKNNISTLFGIWRSVRRSKEILSEFDPDVVVGTGGYASFPTVYAASQLGIPTAIHESNAIPGLTTSLLSRKADRIMVGFESADRYKHPERVVLTGTPVREEFIFTRKSDAKKLLGLEGKPLVVSSWGSLGAREMNKKIAEFIAVESKTDDFFHIHGTGSFGWKWMPDYVRSMGVDLSKHPNIDMREYIYDMPGNGGGRSGDLQGRSLDAERNHGVGNAGDHRPVSECGGKPSGDKRQSDRTTGRGRGAAGKGLHGQAPVRNGCRNA